jgi:hypothetical protein
MGLSKIMQSAWAAFVKDPANGLGRLGWPKYDAGGKLCARFMYVSYGVVLRTDCI